MRFYCSFLASLALGVAGLNGIASAQTQTDPTLICRLTLGGVEKSFNARYGRSDSGAKQLFIQDLDADFNGAKVFLQVWLNMRFDESFEDGNSAALVVMAQGRTPGLGGFLLQGVSHTVGSETKIRGLLKDSSASLVCKSKGRQQI